jgi:hypothetical protein
MREVEKRLNEWNHLYQQLQAAGKELGSGCQTVDQEKAERLRLIVARLQHDADAALQAVHCALAIAKEKKRPD